MQSDKFKLGLFIVIAFFLLCSLFIVFGLSDYGDEKVPVITYFKESVQGLENGSLVKLRGVPIGKVTDITIYVNEKTVRVDMEINLSKIRVNFSQHDDSIMTVEKFHTMMKKEIQDGLSAQLELNGISGYKYVELDYRAPDKKFLEALAEYKVDQDHPFIFPSKPSMLGGLKYNLTEMVAKIAAIDYTGIADHIDKTLDSIEKLFLDPQIRMVIKNASNVTDEANKLLKSVNNAFSEKLLRTMAADIAKSIQDMRDLLRRMEVTVQQTRLPETAASFRETTTAVIDAKVSILKMVDKLNETLDSIQELTQSLNENPDSLIAGKKKSQKEFK